MILVIGGSSQGKTAFAAKNYAGMRILNGFHSIMKTQLEEGIVAVEKIIEGYDVIISDEIGCGIVPIDKFERYWREETGRALCFIAQRADEVYRVYAGIAVRIK